MIQGGGLEPANNQLLSDLDRLMTSLKHVKTSLDQLMTNFNQLDLTNGLFRSANNQLGVAIF